MGIWIVRPEGESRKGRPVRPIDGMNRAPVAQFTVSISDLSVSVDASTSTDSDGTIIGWRWDFGDGTVATGVQARHLYARAGTYTIGLVVVDNIKVSGETKQQVAVSETIPNIAPISSFTTSVSDLMLSCDGVESYDPDGTIVSWAWTFGDGGTGTEVTATHTYAAAGTYTVGLTVTDAERLVGFSWKSITVTDPAPTFTLRVTEPSLSNTGYRYPLTVWAGTTGTFRAVEAGAVYDRIDFGSTWVDVQAANITFRDCKFRNTKACSSARGMISASSSSCVNLKIEFCEFVNASSESNVSALLAGAIIGHDFTISRCNIRGFSDGIGTYVTSTNINGNINTLIEGCYISELSFWYNPVKGIVHPSDDNTHNDVIQHQGGRGLQIIGNCLRASYSDTIGTMYTTGRAGDPRYDIVDGGGVYEAEHNGGSLACLMINGDRGATPDMVVEDNWMYSGMYSVNCGDPKVTGTCGRFWRNKFYRGQRVSGWAIGIRSASLTDTGWNATSLGSNAKYAAGTESGVVATSNINKWLDNNTNVIRKNA